MPARALIRAAAPVVCTVLLATTGCRTAVEPARVASLAPDGPGDTARPAPAPAIDWTDGLSLEELLAAVEGSPPVEAARRGIEGAAARLDAAGTPRNRPELEFEAAQSFDGDTTALELRASQTFELGGGAGARRRAAGAALAGARAEADAALSAARAAARRGYFQALAARRDVELAREAIALADRVVEVAQARLDAGQVAAIDVSLARVGAGRARAESRRAEGEFEAARAELGMYLPGAPEGWDFQAAAVAADLRVDERRAVLIALDRRADLAVLAARVEESEAQVSLTEAEAAPELTVGLGYEYERDRIEGDGIDIRSRSHTASLSIGLPLPLWNPSAGEAGAARAQARRSEAEAAAARARIAAEVRAAARRMHAAAETVALFTGEILPAANRNLADIQGGYSAGELSISDLLRAQEERQSVASEAARAEAAYGLRRAELEAVVGAPLSEYAR